MNPTILNASNEMSEILASKRMSRRSFLKLAGVTVGASSLACCGFGYTVTQKPAVPEQKTPSFSYGKDATNPKRILVAYATRTGSTVGVASAIGETLSAAGYGEDVKPIDEGSRKNRLAYLDNVRSVVKPVAEAYFAGLGTDPVRSSLLERWMNRVFKIGPEGDCRDWNKICAWAKSLCLLLN